MKYKVRMTPQIIPDANSVDDAVKKLVEKIKSGEITEKDFEACSSRSEDYHFETTSIRTEAGYLETWADASTKMVGIQLKAPNNQGVDICVAECNEFCKNPTDVKVSVFEDITDGDYTSQFVVNGEILAEMAKGCDWNMDEDER